MERDMELVRKVLIAIEEQYVDVVVYNLKVQGYGQKQVAYHCKILYDAGLISDYGASFGNNELGIFGVGSLTWEGHEFLDKIRSETVWNKTKEAITQKGLPWALDVIKDVASAVVTGMVQGAIKGGL